MRHEIGGAFRFLRRQPVLSAVVVATLALGIGANTAAFSLVDAVLLRALPVERPHELVLFEWTLQANRRIAYLTGDWRLDADTNQVRAASFSRPALERFTREGTTLAHVFACDALGLSDGMRLVAAGAALGLLGANALTRVIASVLFGVGAGDPLTYGAAGLVLATAALLACWLPAHRAARIDPAVALRYE